MGSALSFLTKYVISVILVQTNRSYIKRWLWFSGSGGRARSSGLYVEVSDTLTYVAAGVCPSLKVSALLLNVT